MISVVMCMMMSMGISPSLYLWQMMKKNRPLSLHWFFKNNGPCLCLCIFLVIVIVFVHDDEYGDLPQLVAVTDDEKESAPPAGSLITIRNRNGFQWI